jgi:DNA-binding NtrC family response regulator
MAVYPDLKIFIVDDDIFCLTLYNQFLKNLGYGNVTSFTGGHECLDHLNAGPELIFLDYNMEGMNGIDVLKRIKELNPNIAVYIITGKEDPRVAAEAVNQGAVDYIVKSSLSPDKMKAIMERVEELQAGKPREAKRSKGFFSSLFRGQQ